MLNIECTHTNGYDCLDDAMAIALKKHKLNYNFVFTKSWCFNYNCKFETIGQALDGNRGDRFEILNQIFNLEFDCIDLQNKYDKYPLGNFLESKIRKVDNVEELISDLKDIIEKENKEIIIQYDTFYSPWDNLYEKYHGTHMCYVNLINQEEIELYDCWYSKIKKIKTSECLNMTYKFIIIDFEKADNIYCYNDVINKLREETNFERIKESLKKFKESIIQLDIAKEFDECTKLDYTKSLIMRNLKESIYNNMQLCILFKDLNEIKENKDVVELSEIFEKLSQKIELLRMCIAKEFLVSSLKYSNDINYYANDIVRDSIIAIRKFEKI